MALARQGQSIYRATVNDDSDAQFAVTMVTYTLTPDPELQKGKSPIKPGFADPSRGDKTQVPQRATTETLRAVGAHVNALRLGRK